VTARPGLEALRVLAGEPARACALPGECYLDPGFFELELEKVLRPGWHAVAHASQLAEPGDYRSVDLLGTPLLVLRDESRRLRAFSRVCLHRALPIVEGAGNTRRFSCPYHRWAYDLDGRLRAAPSMNEVPGFDRDACRLPELPIEEWQGFAFVSLDPTAESLSARLGPLTGMLAPEPFDELVVIGSLAFDSPFNWKVLVENFVESYHHQGPHLETLQPTNPAAGTHAVQLDAPVALIENPAVEGAQPFWAGLVFPTFLFAYFRTGPTETARTGGPADLPIASWYEMEIDRHDHFGLRIHMLAPAAVAGNPDAVAGILQAAERVHREDLPMCLGVQHGLHSALWRPGRLAPQEGAVWQFHRLLRAALLTPAPEWV
jgi:phenylpropionate dioxygenase-like ring-hydroxylating dioxygenase large terminal subunit